MKNIYLKFPTMELKNEWLNYLEEYRLDDPNANPLGYKKDTDYAEWLDKMTDEKNGTNIKKSRVPSSIYFLMDNNRIIGHVSIRHNIDNIFLSLYGGHIGYGIRPSERRKGYATLLLRLALEKCNELGLAKVMVTCKEENIASSKTIEKNHGVLKEIIYIPLENCNFKIYWINVKEGLND